MKGGEEQLPLRGQGSKVRALVFFLMSSRRLEGGGKKVCRNRHCFPECQLQCLCAVEARWGSRSPFLHQKFLNVLTEKWIYECGRKQKLNSVWMGYISCEASVACLVL